uniref:heparinase II/III domain-containing protein n=1 Tax=uncultured Draconibacterium sp. TaxID=1573823 RepID=UPI003217751B
MKYLLLGLLLALSVKGFGWEERNLLQKKADTEELKSCLIYNQKWVSYPAYSDRQGWDKLTTGVKEEIIRRGEQALEYEWKVVSATDYLEFERSGSRDIMQNPFGRNNSALADLVMAELAEGKGRFLDQISNGIWLSCEMTSWALSAHVSREQEENTSLPSYKENIIDLTAGDMGSFFAWTYYFLKDELAKVQPLIPERLRQNLQERLLDPFMNRTYWWMASNATPETMVNNWNPWCNFNVLTCFLLLENNPDKLANAVSRTMESVDKFINYTHEDGACEEGPSYWGHAAGKMYDYLSLLSRATNGKVSVFDQPMIKNMGEYIAKSYVGSGWVVNFADASARGGGQSGLIYRYGKAVGSNEMQQFAAYLFERDGKKSTYSSGRDMYRTLENLISNNELPGISPATPQEPFTWYPETEFCYMRNGEGFFFAAKGGYNNESHNHNDMGTFSLYLDNTPMIIDIGVGTYTRQTFSSERYSIWTMQSNYHNLPMITGVPQAFGSKFRSKDVEVNESKSYFSVDLASAYPDEAKVKSWNRSYRLYSDNKLLIEDKFSLSEVKGTNQLNFMTWGAPKIEKAGSVIIEKEGKSIQLKYDSQQFEAAIETIEVKDPRLTKVWGDQVYRLSLNARKNKLRDNYKITIEKR